MLTGSPLLPPAPSSLVTVFQSPVVFLPIHHFLFPAPSPSPTPITLAQASRAAQGRSHWALPPLPSPLAPSKQSPLQEAFIRDLQDGEGGVWRPETGDDYRPCSELS